MEIDFGWNWREFRLDGTTYRHRMESGKYEIQKWKVAPSSSWFYSPTGYWVTCKRPKGAPEL